MIPFFRYILLSTEEPAWGTGFFFFSWCLATEGGWGWQNEDAAGSWGEQKEGKDRRLADDAGESGSKVLPWESSPGSGAECTFPAPVCCCQQWQGIFWREFHVLTLSLGVQLVARLAGAGLPVQWQSAVAVAKICVMDPNIPAFHRSHSNFNWAQQDKNLFLCLKGKRQEINLKLALNSILDIATSKSSALCSHLIFFRAIPASLRGILLEVKGTEWASRWLQPVSVFQQLNDALGTCILPLAEL